MATDFGETNASFPFDSCNLLLGKGGSGAVFLARHHESRRLAAVKRCYARKGDRELHPSPTSFPRSPTAVFPDPVLLDRGSSLSNPGRRDSNPSSAPVFFNEIEMREESNLETAALSQHPHHDATSPLAPPTGSCTTTPGSPGSPNRMDEAMILEYLGKHAHIVDYLGSYTSSRRVKFFAMELMDSDVGRELRSGNRFVRTEEACLVLGYHILGALQHIHGRGVAHRDVKPCNIFLKRVTCEDTSQAVLVSGIVASSQTFPEAGRPSTYVKAHLGDFSAAHLIGTSAMDSTTLATRGTLFYKAPEQLLGRSITDFAALDMWALGCTLVEVFTGCVAFAGSSELQILLQQLHQLGSSFTDYPAQTGSITLFDSFGVSPQSARLVDLLAHLLALDPAKRFTAKQALEHPFFAVLRQRQQHLAQQLRTTESEVDTVGTVSVYLKARLLSTRCPEAAQLRVSFRPVALTPYHKRQRAERERAEMQQFVSSARQDSSLLQQRVSSSHDSGCESDRPARSSHRSEPGAEAVSSAEIRPGAHQNLFLSSPHEGSSFVSDGPSLHWSQVRSFVGVSGEGSSFLEHRQRTSEEEKGNTERRSAGKDDGSRGTSLLLPSPHAGSESVPHFSLPRNLLASPGDGRMVRLAPPASNFAGTASAVTRTGPAGACGRPVLIAASGTAFTASNLRAYNDFEACVGRGSRRLSGSADGTASFRALTYSSDERVLSPTSFADTQTGSTSFESSSGEKNGEHGPAPPKGGAVLPAAPARARKMLLFESPNPHRQQPMHALPAPGLADVATPRGAAGDTESGRKPTYRMSSADLQNQTAEGSDGVDASIILGFESRSPHSDGIRSCCSSVTATPLNFLRTECCPPAHALCQAVRRSGTPSMPSPMQQQRGAFLAAAPPLSVHFMEAANTNAQASASTPEAVAATTRRPSTATPTIAALRGAVRKTTTSGSSVASSTPKAMLRERSLNGSHESILSARCSPVPRRVPTGPGGPPLQQRLRQSLPVNRRHPVPLPQQPLPPRPPALGHRDPFGRTFAGNEDEAVVELTNSLSLSTTDAAPAERALLLQLSDALSTAAATAQHLHQQRHCTPSLEPVPESVTNAMFDSRERSASARLGVFCNAGSTPDLLSDDTDESVRSGSGTKKRSKYETPVA